MSPQSDLSSKRVCWVMLMIPRGILEEFLLVKRTHMWLCSPSLDDPEGHAPWDYLGVKRTIEILTGGWMNSAFRSLPTLLSQGAMLVLQPSLLPLGNNLYQCFKQRILSPSRDHEDKQRRITLGLDWAKSEKEDWKCPTYILVKILESMHPGSFFVEHWFNNSLNNLLRRF